MSETTWVQPLVGSSMDRRGPRTLIGAAGGDSGRSCHKISGVDGTVEGGLRPFPGFRQVYEFNVQAMNRKIQTEESDTVTEFHGAGTHITDFESFTFQHFKDAGDEVRDAWGIVYRAHRSSDPTVFDLFFDYYVRADGTGADATSGLRQAVLLKADVNGPYSTERPNGSEMQVAVFGTAIYVMVQGQRPIAIRPDAYDTPDNGGPGEQPKLSDTEDAEDENYIIGDASPLLGRATETDNAAGFVIMTSSPPENLEDNTNLSSVSIEQGTTDDYDGDELRSSGAQLLTPGDYAFAFFLYDSTTGRRSPLSTVGKARFQDFVIDAELLGSTTDLQGPDWTTTSTQGDYPSSTAIDLYGVFEIVADGLTYDQIYIFRSVQADSAGGTYAAGILHLENIIDISQYQVEDMGSGYYRVIYYVSKDDRELVFQPTFSDTVLFDSQMPYGGSTIYFDGSLLVSTLRDTPKLSSSSYKNAPDNAAAIRSAGQIRWSSPSESSVEMFLSSDYYIPKAAGDPPRVFHRVGPNVIGLGENRQYLVTKNGVFLSIEEIHEGYGAISSYGSDVVGSLLYFVNDKGVYTTDAYGQLEQVNSLNWPIFNDWRGDTSRIGNGINTSYSAGHPLSMAFDSDLSALFIHNENRQECYVMWFTTSKVTMLEDLPFTMVKRGFIPTTIDPDDFIVRPDEEYSTGDPSIWSTSTSTRIPWTRSSSLGDTPQDKALFLFNNFKRTNVSDHQQGRMPGLYVINDRRDLQYPSGTRIDSYIDAAENYRYTMLNGPANAIYKTASQFTVAGNGRILTLTDNASVWNAGQYGRVVYSSDSSKIGIRFKVMNSGNDTIYDYDGEQVTFPTASDEIQIDSESATLLNLLPADSVIAIGHIPFEVQTWPVGLSQDGQLFGAHHDYYRMRQIDSVGCLFTEVKGWPNLVDNASQRSAWGIDAHMGSHASLYRGDEESSYLDGTFKDENGDTNSPVRDYNTPIVASFGQQNTDQGFQGAQAGPLTPGYKAYLVDSDFRLLNLSATGRIKKTNSSTLLVDT